MQTKIFLNLFSDFDLRTKKQKYVDSLCCNSLETPCNSKIRDNLATRKFLIGIEAISSPIALSSPLYQVLRRFRILRLQSLVNRILKEPIQKANWSKLKGSVNSYRLKAELCYWRVHWKGVQLYSAYKTVNWTRNKWPSQTNRPFYNLTTDICRSKIVTEKICLNEWNLTLIYSQAWNKSPLLFFLFSKRENCEKGNLKKTLANKQKIPPNKKR